MKRKEKKNKVVLDGTKYSRVDEANFVKDLLKA